MHGLLCILLLHLLPKEQGRAVPLSHLAGHSHHHSHAVSAVQRLHRLQGGGTGLLIHRLGYIRSSYHSALCHSNSTLHLLEDCPGSCCANCLLSSIVLAVMGLLLSSPAFPVPLTLILDVLWLLPATRRKQHHPGSVSRSTLRFSSSRTFTSHASHRLIAVVSGRSAQVLSAARTFVPSCLHTSVVSCEQASISV